MLGLAGTRDKEPEIALAELERLAGQGREGSAQVPEGGDGPVGVGTARRRSKAELDDQQVSRFRTACQDDEPCGSGCSRSPGWCGTTPSATRSSSPRAASSSRRGPTGAPAARTTRPESLTEPIVQYTLEPLVYVGPAEGQPKDSGSCSRPRNCST